MVKLNLQQNESDFNHVGYIKVSVSNSIEKRFGSPVSFKMVPAKYKLVMV